MARALAILIVAGVGLAACSPRFGHRAEKPLQPLSRLACPDSEGGLTRSSQAPNGSACVYSGPDGAQVQLRLVRVTGDPENAVQPLEAQLKAELPPSPAVPAPAPAPAPAGQAQSKVDINVPGVSIHADDRGATVNAPGVHIDADNQHSSVHVTGQAAGAKGGAQVTVDANDSNAVIHTLSFGPNFDESLILASQTPGPQGWKTVGYDARGPRSGPLVVATVQSRSDHHDELFNDVKALVHRVAGG